MEVDKPNTPPQLITPISKVDKFLVRLVRQMSENGLIGQLTEELLQEHFEKCYGTKYFPCSGSGVVSEDMDVCEGCDRDCGIIDKSQDQSIVTNTITSLKWRNEATIEEDSITIIRHSTPKENEDVGNVPALFTAIAYKAKEQLNQLYGTCCTFNHVHIGQSNTLQY